MKAPLAAVTMVYNEPEFLPVWLRHYTREVGADHCYVIDHGSDDGSTDALGCRSIRIPRSPQDDARRTYAIGHFCAGLLAWYDHVLYCDVDELVMADPAQSRSLYSLATTRQIPCLTATGFDLLHRVQEEPDLEFTKPISVQRTALRFSAAMCKPCLISQTVTWSPGFHSVAEFLPNPDPALFLIHLRYADLTHGLIRLARTRQQPWCHESAGRHQRMEDEEWRAMLTRMAALDWESATLLEEDPALEAWRQRIREEAKDRADDPYPIDLSLSGNRLWPLPKRLLGLF